MKITLTFTLPDEQEEYTHASKGAAAHDALAELAAAFRNHRKYDGPEVTEENFYDILNDLSVSVE